ncbi:MAG: DUF2281 domain-containing protein [Anaerolineae bacterium]|nr:DUF2281 domain-containing protein [Anaerolineae bacterium]
MSTQAKSLTELVQESQPGERDKVREFVEFLLARRERSGEKKLTQSWAGALRDYRNKYTSLELERLALDWREH